VVAKIEWHQGELFPRVGFIVTHLWKAPEDVVHFYNGRGTAEQWIKKGKNAVKWTKLSCRTFKDNQTRLQLFALAYNLANFLRRLALPPAVRHWSLTTLREKLVKIGAKVVRHAKYVTFQLAEMAVPRKLFGAILRRIARLRLPQSRGSPALSRDVGHVLSQSSVNCGRVVRCGATQRVEIVPRGITVRFWPQILGERIAFGSKIAQNRSTCRSAE
jgi:Transposase DDE domain group 1